MKFIMAPYLLPHPTDGLQRIPSGGSLGVGNGLGGAFHGNRLPMRKVLAEAISIAGIDTDSNGGNGGVVEYDGGGVHSLLWDNGTGTANANGRTPAITITVANIFSTVEACGSGSELGPVDKFQDDADVNFSSATGGGYCGSGLVVADQVLGDHAATYDGGSCGVGGFLLPEAVAIEYGNLVEMKDNNKLAEEEETILALLLGATKGSDAFKALPLMSNKLMSEKKYKKSNKKGDKLSGEYGGAKGNMDMADNKVLSLAADDSGGYGRRIWAAVAAGLGVEAFVESGGVVISADGNGGRLLPEVEEVTVLSDDGTNSRDDELRDGDVLVSSHCGETGGVAKVDETTISPSVLVAKDRMATTATPRQNKVLSVMSNLLSYKKSVKNGNEKDVQQVSSDMVVRRRDSGGNLSMVSSDVVVRCRDGGSYLPMLSSILFQDLGEKAGSFESFTQNEGYIQTPDDLNDYSLEEEKLVGGEVEEDAFESGRGGLMGDGGPGGADTLFCSKNDALDVNVAVGVGGSTSSSSSTLERNKVSAKASLAKRGLMVVKAHVRGDGGFLASVSDKVDEAAMEDGGADADQDGIGSTDAEEKVVSTIWLLYNKSNFPIVAMLTCILMAAYFFYFAPSFWLVGAHLYISAWSTRLDGASSSTLSLSSAAFTESACATKLYGMLSLVSALQDAVRGMLNCSTRILKDIHFPKLNGAKNMISTLWLCAADKPFNSGAIGQLGPKSAQRVLRWPLFVFVSFCLVDSAASLLIEGLEEKDSFGFVDVHTGEEIMHQFNLLRPGTGDTTFADDDEMSKKKGRRLGFSHQNINDLPWESKNDISTSKVANSDDPVEPFTLSSLRPDIISAALDTAREKVFDYAAEEIVDAFGVNGIPTWVTNISSDTINTLQSKVIECFEGLDENNLSSLQDITNALSDFDPEIALDKALAPEERESCPSPGLSFDKLSNLPDITSVKDSARELSLHLYDCLRSTVSEVDLGFSTSEPLETQVAQQGRYLGESSICPPKADPDWGVSVALSAGITANVGVLNRRINEKEYNLKITSATGIGIEAGYDSGTDSGAVGWSVAHPLSSFSVVASRSYANCTAGFYCAKSPVDGATIPVECPPGYFCEGGRLGTPTSPGPYCRRGFFCPPGSTTDQGEPVKSYQFKDFRQTYTACIAGRPCPCRAGYYCPFGSSTPKGKPRIGPRPGDQRPYEICQKGQECNCPIGYYCPANSPEPIKCTSTLLLASCGRLSNCRNPECSFSESDPQKEKSILRRLVELAGSQTEFEVGVSLSVQTYWDISAAPWNGSNGHGVTIPLPFKFLPSISLIFGAPPWHCLGDASYPFSGIGLDILDVKKAVENVKGVVSDIREADASAWTTVKDLVKEKWRKFDFKDFLKKEFALSSDFEIGVGYSYDGSFIENGASSTRYKWCGACESCSDCDVCADGATPDGASDECQIFNENECYTRRECSSPPTSPPSQDTLRFLGETNDFPIGNKQSRALQLTDSEKFVRLISTFSSIFSGSLILPFCWGEGCQEDPRDDTRVIDGVIQSSYDQDCGGVKLSVELPRLILKQILSVIFEGGLPLSEFLDPLYNFGITRELELSLTLSGLDTVTFRALLPSEEGPPASFDDDNSDILVKIINFIKSLQLELYARVERTVQGPDLIAGTCVSIGLEANEPCLDLLDGISPIAPSSGDPIVSIAEDTLQFSYFLFQLGFRKPPGLPTLQAFIETAIGIKICPDGCPGASSSLSFQGSVRGELGSFGFTLGGGLKQIGTYYNAFGSTRLHLSNFLVNAQFGVTFPVPSTLNIGGQACVGLQTNCDNADPDSTVRFGAFLGFSSQVPGENYVVAFAQKVTLKNVLRALGMDNFDLPPELGGSGILPPITAPESCGDEYEYNLPQSTEEAALGLPPLDLECVAYIAITSKSLSVPGIEGTVEAGYSVAGRLLLQYGVLLDLSVEANFNPLAGPAFKIDGSLKVDFPENNPVATIRQSGSHNDNPARLFVEGSPSSLAIKIDGRIAINDINTFGDVNVTLDSKRLQASGDLEILGVLKSSGDIIFEWDMSYFSVSMKEFGIDTPGVGFFGFKDILLEFTSNGLDFSLILRGKFQVAGFDLFQGDLEINKSGNDFMFSASLKIACLIDFTLGGTLDTSDLADSKITTFKVGPDTECLDVIGGGIYDGTVYIIEGTAGGLRDLEDDLQAACDSSTFPVLADISCVSADLAGGSAQLLEDGLTLLRGQTSTGLASELYNDEDEWDCLAYVPVKDYGTKDVSTGLYSWSPSTTKNNIRDLFNSDYEEVNPTDEEYGICIGATAVAAAACFYACFVPVMVACFLGIGIDADSCPGGSDRSIPKGYSNDIGKNSVNNNIGGFIDDLGCPKIAIAKSARLFGTSLFGVETDLKCYNDVLQLQAAFVPLLEKADDVLITRETNACLLENFGGNGPRILSEDAYEIPSPNPTANGTTYEEVYVINQKPGETTDGNITLKYKTREFTNDGSGGCYVSDLFDKKCDVIVPRGPEGTLNRFIEQRLQLEFTKCIVGSLTEFQQPPVLPTTPTQAILELPISSSLVVTTCNTFDSEGVDNMPVLVVEDALCQANGKSPEFFFEDSNPTQLTDSVDHPCGTQKITRTWTAVDGCRLDATASNGDSSVTQKIYIYPDKPIFINTTMPGIQFTTSKSPLPSRDEYPLARTFCGGRPYIDYEDVSIEVSSNNGCNSWTMMRSWTVREELDVCEEVNRPTSYPLMQMITITDDTPPKFVDTIKRVRVPFFANYQPNNNVPRVRDSRANVGYGIFADQLVNQITLQSNDGNFTKALATESNQTTCSTDGVASFTRTWTIHDACSNRYEELQDVVIEHPPSVLAATDSLEKDYYARAPGVSQGRDNCAPGKDLHLGQKVYTPGPNCGPGNWDENGCQVIEAVSKAILQYVQQQQMISPEQAAKEAFNHYSLPHAFESIYSSVGNTTSHDAESQFVHVYLEMFYANHSMELNPSKFDSIERELGVSLSSSLLLAVKPYFDYQPPDATISTQDSTLPSNLTNGNAIGASFCGAPYEVYYTDSVPQKEEECGTWTMKRTWSIRPIYEDCLSGVVDPRLTDSFIQTITIKDSSPPEFIDTPSSVVKVGFLQNYGPDVTGVPRIEDISLSDSQGPPLSSYPIYLTYNDSVVFADLNDCNQEASATIERKWSATDNCDQTSTWTQTILIERSSSATIGEASVYQVVTTGPSHLSHTDIAEEFVTSGRNKTSMDHVLLSSGFQNTSWNGLDPETSVRRHTRRLQRPNGLSQNEYNLHKNRGVPANPSICTGNYLDYDLVMEICPKHENIKDVFLTKSSAGHGPKRGQENGNSDRQCVLDKLRFVADNATLDFFQDGEQPIRFDQVSDEIERFSDTLAYDMVELVTGPKTIKCLSQDQSSCSELETSISNQKGEVRAEGEKIELIGSGMVYNFFEVPLKDWFYPLSKPRRPNDKRFVPPSPKVLVSSPGFVFVNLKYQSTVKLTESKKGKKPNLQPSVRHDFQTSEDEEEFYFGYPMAFGDPVWPNFDNTNTNLIVSDTRQWVPRQIDFAADALGQEYFLVNIPNPDIDNQNKNDITNEKEVAALAISFTDSEAVGHRMIWPGTLLVGNKHTSLHLKKSTLLGGQLFMAGGKLELEESSVLCGKYAANRPCQGGL